MKFHHGPERQCLDTGSWRGFDRQRVAGITGARPSRGHRGERIPWSYAVRWLTPGLQCITPTRRLAGFFVGLGWEAFVPVPLL